MSGNFTPAVGGDADAARISKDEEARRCPAWLIAAPASGQGKTTVTAALARRYRDRGLTVRVLKTGPDFLDPLILERASGAPVRQLDLWMGGEAHCRQLLYDAAGEADLILVEGVMGLFDGTPSSADLAQRFSLPVLAVIDGAAMAQTFGAVAHGLASYRATLPFAGVVANRVAGEKHFELLLAGLAPPLSAFGWLPRAAEITLPERHLGLLPAAEIADLDARIEHAAHALNWWQELPEEVSFTRGEVVTTKPLLAGVRIAVARDAAFTFLYRANLELLETLGASVCFFSPLADAALPDAEVLYLPGGYPELHLERLAANTPMRMAIRAHHAAGKPLYAECGGMLYLLEALTNAGGETAPMAALLPGRARLQRQLVGLGMHEVTLPEGTLRGHSFHYSRVESGPEPFVVSVPAQSNRQGEAVYRTGRLTASYLHLYFPSNPLATARLFAPERIVTSPSIRRP